MCHAKLTTAGNENAATKGWRGSHSYSLKNVHMGGNIRTRCTASRPWRHGCLRCRWRLSLFLRRVRPSWPGGPCGWNDSGSSQARHRDQADQAVRVGLWGCLPVVDISDHRVHSVWPSSSATFFGKPTHALVGILIPEFSEFPESRKLNSELLEVSNT